MLSFCELGVLCVLDAIESFAVCMLLTLNDISNFAIMLLDRYVILGGHRDSWVFGGMDPQSGSAVVHEIVRSFGIMKKKGNLNKIRRPTSESQFNSP